MCIRDRQVEQGEKQFDLVVRLEREYRDNPEEIANILVPTPGGQQIPLKEFADIRVMNGASFIYRQDNSRYIGVQFSVAGRDLAGACLLYTSIAMARIIISRVRKFSTGCPV